MAFIPQGNAVVITAGPTVTVANIATNGNAFRFLCANATAYSYVGIFNDYNQALSLDNPVSGTSGYGTILAPNWPDVIAGNFGVQPSPQTVYVAAITAADTGITVVVQPGREA
jgi:hypothetical protein